MNTISFLEVTKDLGLSVENGRLSDKDAYYLIELVLDYLIEVGNGTTQHDLHKCADYLFAFRDFWLKIN